MKPGPKPSCLCGECVNCKRRKRGEENASPVCPKCSGPKSYYAKTCKGCRDHRGDALAALGDRPITETTGRLRANRMYPELGTCEHPGCEKPAVDRHHIDGNTSHNERSNLAFLCRFHHLEVDGRLEAMRERVRTIPRFKKLSDAQVTAIRSSSASTPELAESFGVSAGHVRKIKRGERR